MWTTKLFTSGLHALDLCDPEFYSNVHKLLKIFCTLPSSNAMLHPSDAFQV